ncbi:transglycosylase SLT domain-containing protein [Pseudogemmobacter sp. W21_MBD1_M6]|uniref:transglycosylase SLT domain-containing protein n=1 Tax=Pseudogemmobacter sp. W21_MBD1_M6 TaxID=3240271 RepID=UPI003F944E98
MYPKAPLFVLCLVAFCTAAAAGPADPPPMRQGALPRTQWDHHAKGALWTQAALVALRTHGKGLEQTVPRDIAGWCPAYLDAPPEQRRAFWVGMLSALAKYESRWRPKAVGGGDLWYGLFQILPATARGYGCAATSGAALQSGAANLSCAVRIMARTVPRDRAIAIKDGRWRGVAADWGPMRSAQKRDAMSAWTRDQGYCRLSGSVRPKPRP